MSRSLPHPTPDSVTWEPPDDFAPALLEDVRAYLASRCRGCPLRRPWGEAWEQFYLMYDPLIRRYAVTCGVSAADLDDCAQEVWTLLVAKLATFRHDPRRGRFVSWLYTLVRSRATDLVRRHARHPTESLTPEGEAMHCGQEKGPAAAYERHRQQTIVHGVLDELRERVSERSYRVLYLHWIEGRALSEVAVALGLTPEQAWLCHHRAKQKFRDRFERLTGDGVPRRDGGDPARGGRSRSPRGSSNNS